MMKENEQKIAACKIREEAGADFVKTSTGFAPSGATIDVLKLMRATCSEKVRVKAAGGVRTLDAVLACQAVDCSRCGATTTLPIIEEAEKREAAGELVEMSATNAKLGSGY